jgi:DNA modification methylase
MQVLNKRYDPAVPVSQIKPNPRNSNIGNQKAISESIATNGFYGVCIVNERTGYLVAGEHRWKAAKGEGAKTVPVLYIDASPEVERKLVIADNQLSRLGSFDLETLIEELEAIKSDVGSLLGTGFDDDALASLCEDMASGIVGKLPSSDSDVVQPEVFEAPNAVVKAPVPVKEGNCDDDETPEPEAVPVSRLGDVWICGEHRVCCGDSTKSVDIERLMDNREADICFTSPPYGQQRNYKSEIADWEALMDGVFSILPVKENAQVLVNLGLVHKDGEWMPYWDGWIEDMRRLGWRRFAWYVWDQGPGLPGDWNGRLAPSHEFIFHFNRSSKKANKTVDCKWAGAENHGKGLRAKDGSVTEYSHAGKAVQDKKIADSVFRVMRHKARGIECEHPAVFPVDLPLNVLLSFSDEGAVAYEPFTGSGSQMIACEKTSRVFRGMEIAPTYVDIAVRRWQLFTCQSATLEKDGRTFEQIAAERTRAAA